MVLGAASGCVWVANKKRDLLCQETVCELSALHRGQWRLNPVALHPVAQEGQLAFCVVAGVLFDEAHGLFE